jgi:rubrerythrin
LQRTGLFSQQADLDRRRARGFEQDRDVNLIEASCAFLRTARDLAAERITIDSYRAMIAAVGNDDPTTRRVLETILATEEEHAEDLASLLDDALLPRDQGTLG